MSDDHTLQTAGGMTIRHAADKRVFADDASVPDARAPLESMPTGTFTSSNVHSGIYDFGARILSMRYLRDGPDAIYQYFDVPASTWQGLLQASSKGSYINAKVAFEFRYAKSGRGDFPDRKAITDDRLRRFVYDP